MSTGEVQDVLTDPHAPGRSPSAQTACMAHARLQRPALHVVAQGVASHATLQALSLDSRAEIAGLMSAWKGTTAKCVAERTGCIKQAKKEGTFMVCDPKPCQVPQDRCLRLLC